MSMPQIQPPPGMRGPSLSPIPSHGPGAPLSPPVAGAPAPATIGPGASRRRAYPTAHLAANSISYAGGFDAGANAAGAGYPGAQDAQPQLFTPGAPEQVPSPYAAAQPAPGAPVSLLLLVHPVLLLLALLRATRQVVSKGLTNQFQGMGIGGAGGMAQKFSTLQTVNISGVQPTSTSSSVLLPRSVFHPMHASPPIQKPTPTHPTSDARSTPFPPPLRSSKSQKFPLDSFSRLIAPCVRSTAMSQSLS